MRSMLVALSEQRTLVFLEGTHSRESLKNIRKQRQFFCPACRQRVILKIGETMTPHFAHQREARCIAHFSEGESSRHLAGKKQLLTLFQRFGQAQLEQYIPTIQQRPDIFIAPYAIEFQCSPLSQTSFEQRNQGYASMNLTPIWIPARPVDRQGVQQIKIVPTMQKYMRHHRLLTYDPDRQMFQYATDLIMVTKTMWIGKITHLPLQKQQFPFYDVKPITKEQFRELFVLWQQIRHRKLHQAIRYKRGLQEPIARYLYDHKLSLSELSPHIGVPTNYGVQSTFCLEWQLVYYAHYFPDGVDSFRRLERFDVSEEQVMQYDRYLVEMLEKGQKQIDYLYSQFVAIRYEN